MNVANYFCLPRGCSDPLLPGWTTNTLAGKTLTLRATRCRLVGLFFLFLYMPFLKPSTLYFRQERKDVVESESSDGSDGAKRDFGLEDGDLDDFIGYAR